MSARGLPSPLPANTSAGLPHAVAGTLSHGANSGPEPPSPSGPYRAKRVECAQLAAAFENQGRPKAQATRFSPDRRTFFLFSSASPGGAHTETALEQQIILMSRKAL